MGCGKSAPIRPFGAPSPALRGKGVASGIFGWLFRWKLESVWVGVGGSRKSVPPSALRAPSPASGGRDFCWDFWGVIPAGGGIRLGGCRRVAEKRAPVRPSGTFPRVAGERTFAGNLGGYSGGSRNPFGRGSRRRVPAFAGRKGLWVSRGKAPPSAPLGHLPPLCGGRSLLCGCAGAARLENHEASPFPRKSGGRCPKADGGTLRAPHLPA